MRFTFIETPLFTRQAPDYLDDADFRRLQEALLTAPARGDVIQGTGGFRKLRWENPRRGKGKRGGLRIIYYWLEADQQIWLFTIYSKDEVADLTADEKRALKQAIHTELMQRRST
jgi:mRNA-degrading endonuclease RelE of RelBE toxin-antitoxin system